MRDISDEVLKKASHGDKGAFEELYAITAGFVYGTAIRITCNKGDAEEVTQDVFMKVYHNLKKFEIGTSFKAWLYRITFNTAINAYNKKAKEVVKRDDFENVLKKEPARSHTEAGIDREHYKKKLDDLLMVLNPDQRACILLREIEGLDYKEIARVLKINLNTVRSRLKRARETLIDYARKEVVSYEM